MTPFAKVRSLCLVSGYWVPKVLALALLAAPMVQAQVSRSQGSALTVVHRLNATQLEQLRGRYFWDAQVQSTLGPALKILLGDQWEAFQEGFAMGQPLQFEKGRLFSMGRSGARSSAFEFRADGSMSAAIKSDDNCSEFGKVEFGYWCSNLIRR